ncbi:hypothetical protein AB0B31_15030 [Catellatospora citrea]|uniref:hypothetical protein n=1 Tax=Catellatospora citrea TaxID=53366 RepID=UPI00340B21F9
MNSAALAIATEAAKLPDSALGTVFAAPENRHLKIFWKGEVPQAVQAVIDAERQQANVDQVEPAHRVEITEMGQGGCPRTADRADPTYRPRQ